MWGLLPQCWSSPASLPVRTLNWRRWQVGNAFFVLFSLSLLCPLLFFSLFHVLLLPFLLYSPPPPPLLFHSSSSYLFSFSSFSYPCSSLTSSFTTTTTSSINLAIILPHPQSLQGVFSFALQPTVWWRSSGTRRPVQRIHSWKWSTKVRIGNYCCVYRLVK